MEASYKGSLKEKLGLKKPFSGYLKQIYGDTAISGMGAIREEMLSCGYAYFGSDHIVYGTDYPFGPEKGERFIRENLRPIKNLNVSEEDKNRIFEKTAKKLLKLK